MKMPRGRLRFTEKIFLASMLATCWGVADGQETAKSRAIESPGELSFPDQKRWLGADDAYSIPLENGRSLWLFGDTFIGTTPESPRTATSGFIRNSIGITTCSSGKCSIEYFWAKMSTGKPDSMFSIPGSDWFWPMDGFIHRGKLYIALMQMHAEGNGANFVYFFTLVQGDKPAVQHLGLLRLPLEKLDAVARPGSSAWEYLRTNLTWAKWADTEKELPSDHAVVLKPGASEMSVRYHEATKQWIAVYPTSGLRTAEYALSNYMTHGWQPGKTLYTFPEREPSHPNYTKNVFCYAAKEHVEFEAEGQLVFTYACNSFQEHELFEKRQLYHPIVVIKPLPKM